MSGRKNIFIIFGFVLSVSFIASALTFVLVSHHYGRLQFDLLNAVCGEILEREAEIKKADAEAAGAKPAGGEAADAAPGETSLHAIIAAALKEYTYGDSDGAAESAVLSDLGYRESDFVYSSYKQNVLLIAAGFLAGILLFVLTFLYRNKMEGARIQALADYLEQVNTGKAVILSTSGEDDFSKLEDEIYKTVTFLYQTREEAVLAKKDFAENLSNIAHQIKTPITAISLTMQMMRQGAGANHAEQVEKQLMRLTHLEEALLVLSRLDAGALPLQKNEVDVYTLLVLAADNLQELFAGCGASIDIPESGEMMLTADMDWTMEALMNLLKNCMEHGGGKTVHCSYAQNPLYTQITIWDDGEGFAREDMPHLFERFYRGKDAKEGGIGIGLALAKEIIERQNGTIRARNIPDGGACFEIRFYSRGQRAR